MATCMLTMVASAYCRDQTRYSLLRVPVCTNKQAKCHLSPQRAVTACNGEPTVRPGYICIGVLSDRLIRILDVQGPAFMRL